ncbi:MAG: CotH kinase family protein, partial [Phaeodactylibacter sp.]|nr:CotH kinase family protein [Phaeodactylibacter sp.]
MKRQLLHFLLLCLTIHVAAQEATPPTPPAELILSVPAGFYSEAITLEIQCPGGQVYYTLDGSTPTLRSKLYKQPIAIEETTTIRFLATYKDERADLLEGHTYFIGAPKTDFAVVSLAIDPPTLFHPFHGLFMLGANAVDTLWKKPGANFWSKREMTCNMELFESDGQCVYRSPSGFRLFGGMSRLFPQKSIALVARDEYGERRINHEIFGKSGKKKFKFLVLRNSGSDFGKSHFRDALMTSLVEDWDLETQDNRPAHVYINGRYWGIYNIREKINRYFIDSHFKEVEHDSVDIMEHKHTVKRGSSRHYRSLLRYLEKHDLSDQEHFDYVASQMEIDNFLDFQIAQIYFDNQDAGGNIRYWRPQTERGRWRWILYDTDWGFGLHEPDAYTFNSLAFHTDPEGPLWPNPPWSTFILRKLLENEDCRRQFANRFADRLNTSFQPEHVLQKINFFYERLKPEIPLHLDRWKLSNFDWNYHVNIMRTFAQERPTFVRMHLMEYFQTGAQRALTVGSTVGGQVILNENLKISKDTLTGTYFERFPVELRVVPYHGYRFSHWEGHLDQDERRSLTLPLSEEHTTLYAIFEPYIHPLESKLVINEISPKSGDAGDWIELYNGSE